MHVHSGQIMTDSDRPPQRPKETNQTSLEIGCAPGKWMVFLAERIGYEVHGLEYLASAAETTRKNLAQCGVYGVVRSADFLSYESDERFDLVMSLGFIEHFENYEDIFLKHLKLVREGGVLVLGLPRFRGVNYLIQAMIDPYMECPYLSSHFLPVMELNPFMKLADKHSLQKVFVGYVGGFERALFPTNEVTNGAMKLFVRMAIKLCAMFFGNFDSSLTSSYQIVILRKPQESEPRFKQASPQGA